MEPIKLNKKNKLKHGFLVPDNYFEHFQTLDFTSPAPRVVKLHALHNKWTWAAAAVIVLALAFTYQTYSPHNKHEIDVQTAENYLLHETDLNSEELAEYLSESDLTMLSNDVNISH